MHEQTSYLSLLLVIGLAVLVPAVTTQMKRVRIPIVVGEIVAGIIVGKSGLNLIGDDPWLIMLSTLGFSYLMFLSGLEIDFDMVLSQASPFSGGLRSALRSPLLLGVVTFGLTLAGALALSFGLASFGLVNDPLFMALILSTTSLGLVVPTLKERQEVRTAYGQALLMASLVADFATMLLISIYVIFRANGLTAEMLVVIVLLGAFFTIYRFLLRLQRHPPLEALFRRISEAASHIETRVAFALALLFIALAERLGIEVILGAFLGGLMLSLLSTKDDSSLREQLDAMGYGFFIPIFFIMVGVQFDLAAILGSREALLLVPLLIVIAYLIKILSALVFRFAFDWRRAIGAGLILSSRLSLIIAAAAIGLTLGAISASVNSAIILLAIVTCTLSPILFNRLVPPEEAIAPRGVIIVGGDHEATLLADRLAQHGRPVTLAVLEGQPLPQVAAAGITVTRMPEVTREGMIAIGAAQANRLVALLEDDAQNLRLCQIAKTAFAFQNVVARVNDPSNQEAYTAVGALPVTAFDSEVTVLENLTNNPSVFTLLSDHGDDQEVLELVVRNVNCDGVLLHTLRLPGEIRVMAVRRGRRLLVPRADTRIKLNDVVTVLAAAEEADEVRTIFAGVVRRDGPGAAE